MPDRQQQCEVPLELTPEARKAFADRQAKLITGTNWPVANWYNDEDFCRAYNTAVQLADENARLQERIVELEKAWHDANEYLLPSADGSPAYRAAARVLECFRKAAGEESGQKECPRCSDCKGNSHHWIDGRDGYVCKHCPARGRDCEECYGAGCDACNDEGVVVRSSRTVELETRIEELERELRRQAGCWICDGCEIEFSSDTPNVGHECDLCSACAALAGEGKPDAEGGEKKS